MNAKKLLSDAVIYCDKKVAKQLPYQVFDKESPDYGGLLSESLGFCSATHTETSGFIQYMGLSYCSKGSKYFNNHEIFERILAALKFLESKQRKSGFIDLRERNYDSPPDTAFAIGALYPVAWMAKHLPGVEKGGELYNAIRPFVTKGASAIADHGGFHTPNHRWIIAGAMSGANDVYPELDCRSAINSYFREGIDLNSDGIYSEKSIFYSAHINRKLIDAYYFLGDDYIADNILKNCRCIADLMNDDSSILTSMSIRQDNGKHVFPVNFVSCFYFAAKYANDERLFSAIDKICKKNPVEDVMLIYLFARNPEWLEDDIKTPEFKQTETNLFADTGIWALHRDELDIFVMKGVTTQMCIRFGDVFLKAVKIFAPYFSEATYLGRELTETDNGVRMTIRPTYGAEQRIYMPGYWKPIDRHVSFDELPYNNLKDRVPSPRPDIEYVFDIKKTDGGIDLTVSSNGGIDGAHFALQFDFALPGSVLTENTYEEVCAPKSTILTSGYLTYRKGIYAVKIGPGFFAHSMVSTDEADYTVNMTANLPLCKTIHITFEKTAGHAVNDYYIQRKD